MRLYSDQVAMYEEAHKLNPLAAKIFTFVVWDVGDRGVTFEELTDFFEASKSSVSTSLQLLLQMNLIESTTPLTSRKRHFTVNRKQYLDKHLERKLDSLQNELTTIKKFMKITDAKRSKDGIQRLNYYLNYLAVNIKNLETTLKNLKAIDSKPITLTELK